MVAVHHEFQPDYRPGVDIQWAKTPFRGNILRLLSLKDRPWPPRAAGGDMASPGPSGGAPG